MKKLLLTLILTSLALPGFAADIAKDPEIYVEGVPVARPDRVERGNVALVAILDGTFTDFTEYYEIGIESQGYDVDVYYDPMGSVDYSDYTMLFVTLADNWWYSQNYPAELDAWAAFMDNGHSLGLVGQDFIYGVGNLEFASSYFEVASVVEDVNYGSYDPLDWIGYENGPLGSMEGSMLPCFADNDWFTDEVIPTNDYYYSLVDWSSPGAPGPYNGGTAYEHFVFSTVEFACSYETHGYEAAARFAWWLSPWTAVEKTSFSAVKSLY